MIIAYPVLAGEITKRGIRKTVIADRLGISEKALYNKMSGISSFTWNEVQIINKCFFPDMTPNDLFATEDEHYSA